MTIRNYQDIRVHNVPRWANENDLKAWFEEEAFTRFSTHVSLCEIHQQQQSTTKKSDTTVAYLRYEYAEKHQQIRVVYNEEGPKYQGYKLNFSPAHQPFEASRTRPPAANSNLAPLTTTQLTTTTPSQDQSIKLAPIVSVQAPNDQQQVIVELVVDSPEPDQWQPAWNRTWFYANFKYQQPTRRSTTTCRLTTDWKYGVLDELIPQTRTAPPHKRPAIVRRPYPEPYCSY